MNKKIAFITGTRADYGKLKSLMKAVEASDGLDLYVFVSGMHLMERYGYTCKEIISDGYRNIHLANDIALEEKMDLSLAGTIKSFSNFTAGIVPDLIVVHGDRIDALAGAIVGMLNNIRVAHIEGGELTGTVDESIRHAISKMVHIHFVSNVESKVRLIQLGEPESNIYVIGSPDIDIMLSDSLPDLQDVKKRHGIEFDEYAILIYHPVTTEVSRLKKNITEVIKAVKATNRNYIVIYPNNDLGSNIVIDQLRTLENDPRFINFLSIPFEDFLVLFQNSDFILGNSSCGVRESCVYGIPAIDLGTRQKNRYPKGILANIMHTDENMSSIINCIKNVENYRYKSYYYGSGQSSKLFVDILKNRGIYKQAIQKSFIDLGSTQQAIENYINEVCF